jgi:alpha-glucosidase
LNEDTASSGSSIISHAQPWWQQGVFYQIYPRSFQDSNGDGIGDLQGIIDRLDYLSWLGVDAIWISPFYPSPMVDFGYDISDYCDVDPIFGDLVIFDKLLEQAHRRDLKVIIDFVPNHTSDEHPWFVESRSQRTSSKRQWYIWHDPAPDGGPPNNWESYFGGSAWAFDQHTGQYYLRQFDIKQPDLNWRNPEVRAALYDVMRFWLDRGVDGLRIDVLWMFIKDDQFRDNPINPDWKEEELPWTHQIRLYSEDRPEIHDIVRELRAVMDVYNERVMIGEIYLPLSKLIRYYGDNLNEAHLPFNFQLVLLATWNARAIQQLVDTYEATLPTGAWPNWVLSNHDKPRIASRVGRAVARVASMLLLTLRGTPTWYYGDEIGMQDVTIPPHLAHDPQGKRQPGYGRDPVRTPMQWNEGLNAGFCPVNVQPWLPIAVDYRQINVAVEREDARSMLTLTRELLTFRQTTPALNRGSYQALESGSESCFVYLRQFGNQRRVVALNFSDEPQTVRLPQFGDGQILLSTSLNREEQIDLGTFGLQSHEGCIVALTDAEEGDVIPSFV